MKEDLRRNNNGRGIYIALAICMLAIVCVGVYSALSNAFAPNSAATPAPTETAAPKTVKAPAATKAPAPSVTSTAPSGTLAVKPETDKGEISVSVADSKSSVRTMPVKGKIINAYSGDVLVYSVTMNDYRIHNGVDIAAALGADVLCFADGTVEKIYDDPLMGLSVTVDHGDGIKSVYKNLSDTLAEGVAEGAKLRSGDVIGTVGESALVECAQESHLHFEILKDGSPADPGEFLELG